MTMLLQKEFHPQGFSQLRFTGISNKIELDMFYDYEIKSQIKIYQNLSKSVKTCRIYLCRSRESSAKKNPYRLRVRPNPLFWFRSETQVGGYFQPIT